MTISEGETRLEQNIRRLEEATTRAKAATREANSAAKAANEARKTLATELAKVPGDIERMFDERLAKEVSEGLDKFNETIKTQTDKAQQHVVDEFDKLKNIMMHGNESGEGPSLVDDWISKLVQEATTGAVTRYLVARGL